MKPYKLLTPEERRAEYAAMLKEFERRKALHLNLNMARGKPSRQQLDLVSGILTALSGPSDCFDDTLDVRNYGEVSGLPSAKRLFAELLGTKPEEIFVGGNASLSLMYDLIAKAYTHGLRRSERPWSKEPIVKFLCPAPGYDRHFRISQSFEANTEITLELLYENRIVGEGPRREGYVVRPEVLQPRRHRLFRPHRRSDRRAPSRRAGFRADVG